MVACDRILIYSSERRHVKYIILTGSFDTGSAYLRLVAVTATAYAIAECLPFIRTVSRVSGSQVAGLVVIVF